MEYISHFPSTKWTAETPRTVVLLGSTGSIGISALDVIKRQPDFFKVIALAGGKNIQCLAEQAKEFRPPFLGILEASDIPVLRSLLPLGYAPEVVAGQEGYTFLASLPEASTVLSAQVGAAGLRATYAAATAGKVIALANKESLVLAGHLIRKECARSGSVILPVDSEHNAIFQSFLGHDQESVKRLILTASGGPFFDKTRSDLSKVTSASALAHPNWTMGAKITIDSSTLMNKGLEIIEAYHLFGVPLSNIDVVIHRESVVHSLVEYNDGSLLAQMGVPDMRVAIAYALGWPYRLKTGVRHLDLIGLAKLTFAAPDESTFPCLLLAKNALQLQNGSTIVLNAANEIAVDAFLAGTIEYLDIACFIEQTLNHYNKQSSLQNEPEDLAGVLATDTYAREYTLSLLP